MTVSIAKRPFSPATPEPTRPPGSETSLHTQTQGYHVSSLGQVWYMLCSQVCYLRWVGGGPVSGPYESRWVRVHEKRQQTQPTRTERTRIIQGPATHTHTHTHTNPGVMRNTR